MKPKFRQAVAESQPQMSAYRRRALDARLNIQDRRHEIGLVPLAQFATLRQQRPQDLERDLAAGRLFAVEIDGERWILQALAHPAIDRRRLARLCRVLHAVPVGARLRFLASPKGSLSGLTPIDALIAASWADVIRAAQGFIER